MRSKGRANTASSSSVDSGGIGSVWGALLGVMTIYTIQNILGLLSVNYYMYTAVQSIVILIAIIFENVKNRVIQ